MIETNRNQSVVISKRQGIYAEKIEFKIYYSGEEVYAKRLKELSPLPDMPGLILISSHSTWTFYIFKLIVPSTYKMFFTYLRRPTIPQEHCTLK